MGGWQGHAPLFGNSRHVSTAPGGSAACAMSSKLTSWFVTTAPAFTQLQRVSNDTVCLSCPPPAEFSIRGKGDEQQLHSAPELHSFMKARAELCCHLFLLLNLARGKGRRWGRANGSSRQHSPLGLQKQTQGRPHAD